MRIIKLTTYLLSIILALAIANQVSAATEFVSVVDTGPSGDYSTLSSWEQYNQCNLLTSRVLSHGGITETIADDSYVKGAVSGAYGTVVHVTSTQIAIETITGTFQNSEQIDKTDTLDGAISSPAANVTSSSAPDSIISVASCQGSDADTAAVTIKGWTTSDTNYIKVYTTTVNRHSGVWDSTKYRLTPSAGYGLNIQEEFIRIEGIQITATGSGARGIFVYAAVTSRVDIIKCIVGQTTSYGIYVGGGVVNVINTAEYNSGGTGFHSQYDNNQPVVNIYNSVFCDNAAYGINSGGATRTAKNTYCGGNTTADWAGWGSITDVTCASSDTTATGSAGDNIAYSTSTGAKFVNITATTEDFHLQSGSALIDVGTDTSGDAAPLNFTDDIDGQTRNLLSEGWDIGADEAAEKIYRSVGPSKTTAVDDDNSGTETLTIFGSTATFNTAEVDDNVGVGDVILYDSDGDNDLDASDSIVFIHACADSQNFTVKNQYGGAPANATTANDKWEIYRAYISLSNAEAGTKNTNIPIAFTGGNRDLVANNEQWNIACYANGSTADQTAVTIQNWTTGANNYIKIYTPTATTEVGTTQRHSGVWDEGKYIIETTTTASFQNIICFRESYMRIEGLQLKQNIGHTNSRAINIDGIAAGSDIQLDSLIIEGNISVGGGQGIYPDDQDINLTIAKTKISGYTTGLYTKTNSTKIYNCTVSDCSDKGIAESTGSLDVYNCTVSGCNIGIEEANGIVTAKNCAVFNNTTDFNSVTTVDYCASDDGDGTSAVDWDNEATDWANVFTDYANGNFHLKSFTGTGAIIDQGTDLSAEGFTDDIDGDSRPSPYWDIGADEYPAKQKAKFKGEFRCLKEKSSLNSSM